MSILRVFELKMVQYFMFFVIFLVFCLISLRFKFLRIGEGLLRDKITCYDNFIS